ADRIPGDHADMRVTLAQIAPDAADRSASARRSDDVGHATGGLLPDLRAGRTIVRLRIGLVVELVSENGVWRLPRDPLRHLDVIVRLVGRYRRRRHDDFSAKRLEKADLLLAHLVRDREDAA